jgi:hypothetical protein
VAAAATAFAATAPIITTDLHIGGSGDTIRLGESRKGADQTLGFALRATFGTFHFGIKLANPAQPLKT